MNIDSLLKKLPKYASDVRENAKNYLSYSEEFFLDIEEDQFYAIAIAVALSLKSEYLYNFFRHYAKLVLDESIIYEVQKLTVNMAMHNTIFRYTYASKLDALSRFEHGLIDNSSSEFMMNKISIYVCKFAVSLINNCVHCADYYYKLLQDKGVDDASIQAIIKFVGIMKSVVQVMDVESLKVYDFIPRGENI